MSPKRRWRADCSARLASRNRAGVHRVSSGRWASRRSASSREPDQETRFDQVRVDTDVLPGQLPAASQIAHRHAGLDAEVPEAGAERLDRAHHARLRRFHCQDQQVDIRIGEQFAAAKSADCNQGRVGRLAQPGMPGVVEHAIDGCRARGDDLLGVGVIAKGTARSRS